MTDKRASSGSNEEEVFQYRDVRNRFRFIPFGKFSPSGRGAEPFNQVMVGRLKNRAKFIRRLIEQDRFGAVLVSGRRGSGKTSFVRYALHAYRRETYMRFSRGISERGGRLASNTLGALFAIVVALILTLYSQGIELAVYNRLEVPQASTYWLIGLIAVMMIVPAMLVWSTWRAARAFRAMRWLRHDELKDRNVPSDGQGDGSQGGSYWAKLRRFWSRRGRRRELAARWLRDRVSAFERSLLDQFTALRGAAFAVALVFVFLLGLPQALAESFLGADYLQGFLNFWFMEKLWHLVAVAFFIVVSSAIVSAGAEALKMRLRKRQWPMIVGVLALTCVQTIGYYFLLTVDGAQALNSPRLLALVVIGFGMIVALASYSAERAMNSNPQGNEGDEVRQRGLPVGLLLVAQGVLTIAAAIALISPVLLVVQKGLSLAETGEDQSQPISEFLGLFTDLIEWSRIDMLSSVLIAAYLVLLVSMQQSWIGKGLARERQDSALQLLGPNPDAVRAKNFWNTVHGKDEEDALNNLTTKDKEWSEIAQRRLRRRGHIAREVEAATLARAYYAMRSPVLVLWMNLGFDDLRHARIIEAMLSELRQKYYARFCSLRSPAFQLNLVLLIIATLAATRVFASAFFDYGVDRSAPNSYPKVEAIVQGANAQSAATESIAESALKSIEDPEGFAESLAESRANSDAVPPTPSEPPLNMRTVNYVGDMVGKTPDYCGYFANNPDNAPPATSIACVLPWSNFVLQGLYVRILTLTYPSDPPVDEVKTEEVKSATSDNEGEDAQSKPKEFQFLGDVPSRVLINYLLDRSRDLPNIGGPTAQPEGPSISLRAYHFLLFFLCGLLIVRINRSLQLVPYGKRIKEMDALLNQLQGRITSTTSDGPDGGFFPRLLGLRRLDRTTETEPDPRIVEQSFLDLLRRVGTKGSKNRGPLDAWESPPEIVFVFDEMDKLSGRVDVENARTDEAGTAVEENARDRARSLQLHQLLSDMKRLLGSNAARFIFIGSRLYHDEWLADQANRSPLLSSIFTEEMYLTSLLTDRDHPYGRLNDRIAEYFVLMYQNSESRLYLDGARLEEPEFIQAPMPDTGHPRRVVAMADRVNMRVLDDRAAHYGARADVPSDLPDPPLTSGGRETIEQLLNFLTYRSGGNPKRIQELLGELMQPKPVAANLPGRSYKDRQLLAFGTDGETKRLTNSLGDEDCLVLDDRTLYRMQFIDVLYRHICDHLESRIMDRDDKVAMSVFYLMDFLLKFHNRGFLLTNLQRVDELSHIHRAPDLRSLMGTLVNISSERFLHRVLNGIITYRFRSDFAREIDYLSRISTSEMAALNFTLDESQSLKGLYQQTLKTGDHENVDTVSGLGELYEYDQDYEIARNYYRRAITLLDERFHKDTGREFRDSGVDASSSEWDLGSGKANFERAAGGDAIWSAAGYVLHAGISEDAKPLIRANLPWAMARVRLILQIGHTYEQENNFERALASYMHARRLSNMILAATSNADHAATPEAANDEVNPRSLTMNGASLLYQADFAAAWVLEKDNQDIDESTYQVEDALYSLYARNDLLLTARLGKADHEQLDEDETWDFYPKETNIIFLTASDLHNKSGDLYFYKGKTRPHRVKVEDLTVGRLGYLRRAQRHYANSLHHVRLYMHTRSELSGHRLGPNRSGDRVKPTIPAGGVQPDMVQNALGNTLTDLAETILAQSSISGIISCFCPTGEPKLTDVRSEIKEIRTKLDERSQEFLANLTCRCDATAKNGAKGDRPNYLIDGLEVFGLKWCAGEKVHWIGDWNHEVRDLDHLSRLRSMDFGWQDQADEDRGECDDFQRLVAYIFMSTSAARVYSDAGYPIDAANEYLLQTQTLVSIIWATRYLDVIPQSDRAKAYRRTRKKDGSPPERDIAALRAGLGVFAINALEMAYRELELAYRPSTTGSAQNRGKPGKAWDGDEMKASKEKLQAEYDESQIWRDDPRFKTLAAGLALSLTEFDSKAKGDGGKIQNNVARYAYDNLCSSRSRVVFPPRDSTSPWSRADAQQAFQGLYRTNERHRYPILNRLNTFKQQLDAALILGIDLFLPPGSKASVTQRPSTNEEMTSEELDFFLALREQKGFVGRVSKELLATANLYGSELHFSPHKSGSALALASIIFADSEPRAYFDPLGAELFTQKAKDSWDYFTSDDTQTFATEDMFPDLPNVAFTQESLEISAITQLRRAEETYGLGRAYYENISPLSYLNDDFNDRKIHFGHAIRMLMADVTDLLIEKLSTQRTKREKTENASQSGRNTAAPKKTPLAESDTAASDEASQLETDAAAPQKDAPPDTGATTSEEEENPKASDGTEDEGTS